MLFQKIKKKSPPHRSAPLRVEMTFPKSDSPIPVFKVAKTVVIKCQRAASTSYMSLRRFNVINSAIFVTINM